MAHRRRNEVIKRFFENVIGNRNPDYVVTVNINIEKGPKIDINFKGTGYGEDEEGNHKNVGMVIQYHNDTPHMVTLFTMPDTDTVKILWHAEGAYFEYQKNKIYDLDKFVMGGEKASNN